MIDRRTLIMWIASLTLAGPAMAHHGWRWTADGNFELGKQIASLLAEVNFELGG